MSEELWFLLLTQMQQKQQPPQQLTCVSCWYKKSSVPFPAQMSSCLCQDCATSTRQRTAPRPGVVIACERLL